MTDRPASASGETSAAGARSAGALLRAAREARGLHVLNLAVTLKVPPRKLEALEADRLAEVGDAVFVRALAQAVCRQLGADAQPVLERLPRLDRDPVQAFADSPVTGRAPAEHGVGRRGGRSAPGGAALNQGAGGRNPAAMAATLILLAAVALYIWTGRVQEVPVARPADVPSAPVLAASTALGLDVVPAAASAAAVLLPGGATKPAAPASAASPAATAGGLSGGAGPAPLPLVDRPATAPALTGSLAPIGLTVQADSWVQIRDGRGELLLSRIVRPGEPIELPTALPAQVVIGNAAGTRLTLRGQPVDLAPATRENVARIELR